MSTGGVGEIHLFREHHENPVFKRLVMLAKRYQLPLLIHGDREIIEQVFDWYPQATVIWAHLGTIPEPALVSLMLKKYPHSLYIDTSVRDFRFLKNGKLKPRWRAFFIEHADRLLVAIDTYRTRRWLEMPEVTNTIRTWLNQLPENVALKLAHGNARKLFGSVGQQK